MIDIKFLRENPEIVKENIRKKFQDSKLPMVDEVIALDADRRKAQQEADELKAAKNKIAKERGRERRKRQKKRRRKLPGMQSVLGSLRKNRPNWKKK